jgi:general secretion pathway protein I
VRPARGFTLVEMLVAVAVLAISLAAILSGMARHADNAAYLREKTLALWVAHNRLTEFELQPGWPDVGKSDGEIDMAGQKWKWQAEIKKTTDEHLRRIDLSVLTRDRKGTLVTLSGFLADTGKQ